MIFLDRLGILITTLTFFLDLNQTLNKSNHGQTTLFHFYIALNIWSSLTNSLKATKDINTYKCKVKTHFLDRKK